MVKRPEILFLKQEEVIEAGLLDMKQAIEVAEYTYKLLGENKIIQPNKIFLGIPDEENWESYGMSMPAYIAGDDAVIGFKWAAESVYNASQPGMPLGIDIILLSDPKTMFPKVIMDGTLITAMRTSATAGVCAKYTARKDSKIAALVGAGVIGRTMITAMKETVPSLEEIRIVDLDLTKATALAEEFDGVCRVIPYDDVHKAVTDADLVVTETTSRVEFIKREWLKNNATVIQMEAHSFEKDVIRSADSIYLDSWEQMIHIPGHVFQQLYESDEVNGDDVMHIHDIATGRAKGRVSDDEFVFCGSYGMGCLDMTMANKLYHNAVEKNIGTLLYQWDSPLWV
ncbi:MAG: ornithine cyclodeaminase family protein [Clostridiales bacterium]|nr:ornithine cyclodeaminase family protein [Clostridiales bacterium]